MFNSVVYFSVLIVFVKHAMAITDDQKSEIQTKFLDASAECIKDYPITLDDITFFKNKVFPDSENAGCFAACIFKKVGLFDDKGTLSQITSLENAEKVFVEEEELRSLQEFLTTCARVNEETVSDGEDGCERAKLAYECFVENYDQFEFDIDF